MKILVDMDRLLEAFERSVLFGDQGGLDMSLFKLFIYDNVAYSAQFKVAEEEWKNVRKNGSDIDAWTDGQYLNLIRSKMIELKKLAKRQKPDADFSGWVIPEKVPFELMIKKRKVGERR